MCVIGAGWWACRAGSGSVLMQSGGGPLDELLAVFKPKAGGAKGGAGKGAAGKGECRIVISGASGLVGTALAKALQGTEWNGSIANPSTGRGLSC
jgi:hypothetical protein